MHFDASRVVYSVMNNTVPSCLSMGISIREQNCRTPHSATTNPVGWRAPCGEAGRLPHLINQRDFRD
jgi:hypothetical protein